MSETSNLLTNFINILIGYLNNCIWFDLTVFIYDRKKHIPSNIYGYDSIYALFCVARKIAMLIKLAQVSLIL